jgi:hypothetical protein
VSLLLREGETLTINGESKTVKSMTVLAPVSGSRGVSRAFNAKGQVILRVRFTDGSYAIVTLQAAANIIPQPV